MRITRLKLGIGTAVLLGGVIFGLTTSLSAFSSSSSTTSENPTRLSKALMIQLSARKIPPRVQERMSKSQIKRAFAKPKVQLAKSAAPDETLAQMAGWTGDPSALHNGELPASEFGGPETTTGIPPTPVPDSSIDHCAQQLQTAPDDRLCQITIRQAAGQLDPGFYSEDEIVKALAADEGAMSNDEAIAAARASEGK